MQRRFFRTALPSEIPAEGVERAPSTDLGILKDSSTTPFTPYLQGPGCDGPSMALGTVKEEEEAEEEDEEEEETEEGDEDEEEEATSGLERRSLGFVCEVDRRDRERVALAEGALLPPDGAVAAGVLLKLVVVVLLEGTEGDDRILAVLPRLSIVGHLGRGRHGRGRRGFLLD